MGFQKIKATDTFEVEVDLAGTYHPGFPETGPTYDCGGTPAEPESMEDVEVLSLSGLRRCAGGWTRVKVGPFGAKNDAEAVAIICGVAINADAKIEMLWETRDGKARAVSID